MRHRKSGVKLNRTTSHRQAMFRNMVTSLLKHERIRTTDTKAKELRRWVDHIIGLAKRGDLHARRQAMAIVREKTVVHKIFAEAGEKFGNINGGYTRIVKIGRRPGDAAPFSLIELVSAGKVVKKDKKKVKTIAQADQQVKDKATAGKADDVSEKETKPADETESGDSEASAEAPPQAETAQADQDQDNGVVDAGDETVPSEDSEKKD
jgi:large subunit ribosomal protein L17